MNNLLQTFVDFREEIKNIPFQKQGNSSDRYTKVLIKTSDYKLVLIALKKDAHIKEHHAPGRISVQTLEGHIQLKLPTETISLPKGCLLTVEPNVPHDVSALEESIFLISLHTSDDASR